MTLERAAMRDFIKRMRRVARVYLDALERVPKVLQVNAVYEFQLDALFLSSLMQQADFEVDGILLQGGIDGLWFVEEYVGPATLRGVAQAFANLSAQSPAYAAGRESVAAVARTEPYRQRMLLTRTRLFEGMKGLAAETKADMARVLTDGIGRGLNPRDIARNLTEQGIVGEKRGKTIARTEIATALRRARLDEADDARQVYGVISKEMHISALSPTTRKTHAQRHGKLFTTAEQRQWWSEGGNSINCKCSTVAVLVDGEGKLLVPWIEQRARENMEKMKARGEGPWTEE